MEISHLSDLRPRTVWDVVDDAFDLYRENFALFGGITAVVFVPVYLAQIAWMASASGLLARLNDPDNARSAFFGLMGAFLMALPFYLIAYVLQQGATAVAVEERLLGRPTGIVSSFRRTLSRLWPLLGASLIVGFLAFVGAFALYIGTVVVLVYYAFVSQAVMLERRGAFAAGRRSRQLASGDAARVLGLLVLLYLLWATLSVGISPLLRAVFYLFPVLSGGDIAAQQVREMIMGQVAQSVIGVLLLPLFPIAVTLLYYDLRVRREGLDIEAKAVAIGYPLAADPFGGIPSPVVRRQASRNTPTGMQLPGSPSP